MPHTDRQAEHPISAHFTKRWSPRSYTGEPIEEGTLLHFIEAARWAPSAFNNQPWRFVYALRDTVEFQAIHASLAEFNQLWTAQASALVVVLSKVTLVPPGGSDAHPNRSHAFDAGAAWMSLALEVTANGWHSHAMTGLDPIRLRMAIGAPEDFAIEAAVAIGRQGPKSALPEALQVREAPSARKPLREIAAAGRFTFTG